MSAYDQHEPIDIHEQETLRTGLAELDRSPDLDDAIAAIAREAPQEPRYQGGLRILGWLIPAAAALVVAGVLFFRGGEDPAQPLDGPGEDAVRATVVIPPSPKEVADARTENVLPQIDATPPLPFFYRCAFAKGGLFEGWTDEHFAPIPRARQRWVVRAEEGIPDQAKALSYYSLPEEEGVLLMGPELLVPENAMIRGAGEKLEVHTPAGVWRPVQGTRFLECTLGSPEGGGSTARVRCVLSTAYSGTLLVPNRLARALGLNHFELPGGFVARLGGKEMPLAGQRALARIRIPELGIDRVAEVQARDPDLAWVAVTPKPPGVKTTGRLLVSGALPNRIAHCDELSFAADGTLQVLSEAGVGAGMTLATDLPGGRFELGIHRAGRLHIGLVYDGNGERPAATVVMGAYDFDHARNPTYPVHAEWVTLSQSDEPGARVTIAKVWRGTQARPSTEGVVVTTVAKDGRIRFPRVAGEPASTLRMFIERKKGGAFHDVMVDAPKDDSLRIAFTARFNGTVEFAASRYPAIQDPKKAVIDMRAVMKERIDKSMKQGRAQGPSDWMVEVYAERDAPWRTVQCILQAAAQVGVPSVRFHAAGALTAGARRTSFVDNELLPDKGLSAKPEPYETPATIVVTRRETGGFMLRLGFEGKHSIAMALAEITDKQLRASFTRSLGEVVRGKLGRLKLAPDTARVPYYAIRLMIQAFHDAGARAVVFEVSVPKPLKDR